MNTLEQRVKNIEKLISNYVNLSPPSCVNCTHFIYDKEVCKLVGSRPPARIIAAGCEKYLSEIPF